MKTWKAFAPALLNFFRSRHNTYVPALESPTPLPELNVADLHLEFGDEQLKIRRQFHLVSKIHLPPLGSTWPRLVLTVDEGNLLLTAKIQAGDSEEDLLKRISELEAAEKFLFDFIVKNCGDTEAPADVLVEFELGLEGRHLNLVKGSEKFHIFDPAVLESSEEWIRELQRLRAPTWVAPLRATLLKLYRSTAN